MIILPRGPIAVSPALVKTTPASQAQPIAVSITAGQNAKAITALLPNAFLTTAKLIIRLALLPATVILAFVPLGLLIKIASNHIIIVRLSVTPALAATRPLIIVTV